MAKRSTEINRVLHSAQSDSDRDLLRRYARMLERRQMYETDLKQFVRKAFSILEPTTEFQNNWHIDYICDQLQAEVERYPIMHRDGRVGRPVKKTKDILINVPPRTLKTFITCVCLPAWAWTRRPYLRFIPSSYSRDLTMDSSLKCRNLIQSHWYQTLWGDVPGIDRGIKRVPVVLDKSQRQKVNFQNTAGGAYFATSVGGTVMGKGADFIIADDLQSQKESASEPARIAAVDHLKKGLSTRLNNQLYGVIIAIQQRLHEADVSGVLLGEDLSQETPEELEAKQEHIRRFHERWQFICLPARLRDPESYERVYPPELQNNYVNDLLFPDRYTNEVLDDMEETLGSLEAAGQLGQSPAPWSGGRIKREWIQRYLDVPANMPIYFSIDLPFDDDKQSKNPDKVDYAAICVFGVQGSNVYLLDVINQKWDITKSRDNVLRLWDKWQPQGILIEAAANGPALIKLLKERGIPGIIRIKKPDKSKMVRLNSVAPRIEAGDLWFPRVAIWLDAAMKQLVKFPAVAHDDIMDAIVQFLIWYDKRRSSW